jgi:hypothetical protein
LNCPVYKSLQKLSDQPCRFSSTNSKCFHFHNVNSYKQ